MPAQYAAQSMTVVDPGRAASDVNEWSALGTSSAYSLHERIAREKL
jgi:hypothetical protein